MTLTISRLSCIFSLVAVVGLGGTTSKGASSSSQDVAATQASTALTAASVALLANNFDAAAAETVRRAITSADPSVRAVGARVAGALNAVALAGAIGSALEREQDPDVAAELARALLFLRGAAAGELIESRLDRSTKIPIVYAEWLVGVQPARFADVLPTLAARLGDERGQLNRLVQAGLDNRPDATEPLLRAWLGAATPTAWRTFVDQLSLDSPGPGQDTVLIEALKSTDSGIRESTVWSLVVRLAQGRSVPSAMLDAALAADGQSAAGASPTWEQFGREVIARRHANRKTPDRAALLTAEASRHSRDSRALAVIEQITDSEREALKVALGERYPKKPSDVRESLPTVRTGEAMRTMPTIWPGLLQGLVETTGCKARGNAPLPGAASVAYRPDGRVGQIALSQGLPPECEQVMTALARLTIADWVYPSPLKAPEWLVLPLDREYIECTTRVDSALPEKPTSLGSDPKIEPPRKTRDVRPVYPEGLQKRRVTGSVVIESVISSTGCVSIVRVMRGVDAVLDYAAVHAVSGWRFTPTKVDGRNVAVIMTITVNFTLQ